jgi:hypothetical protein
VFPQRHRVVAIVRQGQADVMLPDPQCVKTLRQLLEATRAYRSGAVDQRHEPDIRPFPVSTNSRWLHPVQGAVSREDAERVRAADRRLIEQPTAFP